MSSFLLNSLLYYLTTILIIQLPCVFLLLLLSCMILLHVLCHNSFLHKMKQGHTAGLVQTLSRRPLHHWAENFAQQKSKVLGTSEFQAWQSLVCAKLHCLLVKWVIPWLCAILGILEFTVNNTAKCSFPPLFSNSILCVFPWAEVCVLHCLCVSSSYHCF